MLRWLGNAILWLFLGSEKTYKVVRVKRDTKNPEYWHVLTECGRQLIFSDVSAGVSSGGVGGYRFHLSPGDEFTIRFRGKGMYAAGLEKDPFIPK